ncbi:MAG: DUF5662 family protein [Lachnospiraceae bacterium]|nr:DUF5662 family protein [Lachnospiraceae bacterium]
MSFIKLMKHLKTITHHRNLVMIHCFKCGLYKQGLLHDLSKYSITELRTGAKYYQGDRSPNTAEREDLGYSRAWLHHKGRNLHHLEYWIDYSSDLSKGFTGMKMPVKYVVEMFCDRMAACKTYQKDKYKDSSPLEYYNKGKHKYQDLFNNKSQELLEYLLNYLANEGEEKTFKYIREEIMTGKADIIKNY